MTTRRRWAIWAFCGLLAIIWGTVVIPQPESPAVDTTDTATEVGDQVKGCLSGVSKKDFSDDGKDNITGTWSAHQCDGAPTDC